MPYRNRAGMQCTPAPAGRRGLAAANYAGHSDPRSREADRLILGLLPALCTWATCYRHSYYLVRALSGGEEITPT